MIQHQMSQLTAKTDMINQLISNVCAALVLSGATVLTLMVAAALFEELWSDKRE